MSRELRRGVVDAFVLAAVYHEDSYGYKIIPELQKTVEISPSTFYPALHRLQDSGCLTVQMQEHEGRVRKYYRITELGKQRLDCFLNEWEEIMKMYEYIKNVCEKESRQILCLSGYFFICILHEIMR